MSVKYSVPVRSADLRSTHDWQTQECLDVVFYPWYHSTHGLSRPATPHADHIDRYWHVVDLSRRTCWSIGIVIAFNYLLYDNRLYTAVVGF